MTAKTMHERLTESLDKMATAAEAKLTAAKSATQAHLDKAAERVASRKDAEQ